MNTTHWLLTTSDETPPAHLQGVELLRSRLLLSVPCLLLHLFGRFSRGLLLLSFAAFGLFSTFSHER